MIELFRKFVKYLALCILIGGMIFVFYMMGRTVKEKYIDKPSTTPTEEVSSE